MATVLSDGRTSHSFPAVAAVTNAEIAAVFDHVADLLEYQGGNVFRVRAYRNAARLVKGTVEPLAKICQSADRSLTDLEGIGSDLAAKIETLLSGQPLPLLKQLESEVPQVAFDLMRVPGLGPKKAKLLVDSLTIESLDDLADACREERVRDLKGFGAKTEATILANLAFAQDPEHNRLLWNEADEIVQELLVWMRQCPAAQRVEAAGSWRRGRETVGDIDLLAESNEPTLVMDRLVAWESAGDVMLRGETKTSIRGPRDVQIDLRVVRRESFGAAWQYFTGSKEHNVRLRSRARDRGLSINEYGVTQLDGGAVASAGATEEEIYAAVGLPWIPPELREGRGEIERAEADRLPELITLDDIRGDLHMHTTATDGEATLSEMAAAAIERGLSYIAITDHSKRVTMAHGLDARRLRKQWREIDKLNESLASGGKPPVVVFKGIEVDMLEKGGLDLPDDLLAEADWVVASLHYGQQQSRERITSRILEAIHHPAVSCIGHPTGRLINRRPAYEVDMQQVIEAAAVTGTCLEINANPWRLDLDDVLAAAAKRAGVTLAISTDAHSTRGLDLMQCGVIQARRAGLEAKDVANTRTLTGFRRLLAKKRAAPNSS
jgi:DNA polymerase (family 10)